MIQAINSVKTKNYSSSNENLKLKNIADLNFQTNDLKTHNKKCEPSFSSVASKKPVELIGGGIMLASVLTGIFVDPACFLGLLLGGGVLVASSDTYNF